MLEAAAILATRGKRQRKAVRRQQRNTIRSLPQQARTGGPKVSGFTSRSWVEVQPIVSVEDRRKERTNLSYNESIVARHDPSTPKSMMSKSSEIRPPVQRDWSPQYEQPIPSETSSRLAKRIADREAARALARQG
jgi:hypothetical protein